MLTLTVQTLSDLDFAAAGPIMMLPLDGDDGIGIGAPAGGMRRFLRVTDIAGGPSEILGGNGTSPTPEVSHQSQGLQLGQTSDGTDGRPRNIRARGRVKLLHVDRYETILFILDD